MLWRVLSIPHKQKWKKEKVTSGQKRLGQLFFEERTKYAVYFQLGGGRKGGKRRYDESESKNEIYNYLVGMVL